MSDGRPGRRGNQERECVAIGECRPKHRAKKPTRRWCKGKVGIEHDWQWVAYEERPNASRIPRSLEHVSPKVWQIKICRRCGKQSYDDRHVHRGCGGELTRTDRVRESASSWPTTERLYRCDGCPVDVWVRW